MVFEFFQYLDAEFMTFIQSASFNDPDSCELWIGAEVGRDVDFEERSQAKEEGARIGLAPKGTI